jgi:hypothetical protein
MAHDSVNHDPDQQIEEPAVYVEREKHRPPPDRLNEIGVLTRREIEARIVAPLVDALGEEFGRERVIEVVREVIVRLAHESGENLARATGGGSLDHFTRGFEAWKKGNALEMEVLEESGERFSFNVTRCRYAELYRALGIPELGAVLSCNRDFAMVEGFNPDIELTRTQTIMQGAAFCDFRYRLRKSPEPEAAQPEDTRSAGREDTAG